MRILYLLLAALLFITSCEKELPLPKNSFPLVTTSVIDIDETGATFVGEIVNMGNSNIVEYGFLYKYKYHSIYIDGVSYLSKTDTVKFVGRPEASFSYKMSSGLFENIEYRLWAYVKTNVYFSKGNETFFTGRAGLEPVIDSFTPTKVAMYKDIEIFGKNLAPQSAIVKVKIGDYDLPIIESSDQKLKVNIPNLRRNYTSKITVSYLNVAAQSRNTLEVVYPWTKKATKESNRLLTHGFLLHNKLYALFSWDKLLLEYDLATGTFTEFQLAQITHSSTRVCSNNDHAYMLIQNNLYEFEPNSHAYVQVATYPDERDYTEYMFLINGAVYVGSVDKKTLKMWDRHSGLWITKTPLNERGACAQNSYFVSENKAYLFLLNGGFNLYQYDPFADVWTKTVTIPDFFSGTFCFKIENAFYVGNGTPNTPMKIFQNGLWNICPNRPSTTSVWSNVVYEGKGLIVSKTGETILEIWEFNPLNN
jgi:hypothetical protein